ncbi:hypothetical protein CVT24_000421 [Panaeolus cyanescens]|uniref:Serine aminopeptidase S33 domain-containing protein n=1 Tax=Panaeolus cyanescens TaxID=181874 RepID=A0A409YDQ1_9AGAR|nr:hypothetical protein CVT24_000421 [Panaeolus cyanescens]
MGIVSRSIELHYEQALTSHSQITTLLTQRSKFPVYIGASLPQGEDRDRFADIMVCSASLRIDAQTVFDAVLGDTDRDRTQKPIFLYGHSLGTAVAIDLASQNINAGKISGLILDTAFTSIAGIIKSWRRFGFLGHCGFLFSEKWPSDTRLAQIPASVSILLLSTDRDPIVPSAHGKALYEIAKERGDKQNPRVDENERGEVLFKLVDPYEGNAIQNMWDLIGEFMTRASKTTQGIKA